MIAVASRGGARQLAREACEAREDDGKEALAASGEDGTVKRIV